MPLHWWTTTADRGISAEDVLADIGDDFAAVAWRQGVHRIAAYLDRQLRQGCRAGAAEGELELGDAVVDRHGLRPDGGASAVDGEDRRAGVVVGAAARRAAVRDRAVGHLA